MISTTRMEKESLSYSLPPRLRRARDFRSVRRYGKRVALAFLVMYVSRRSGSHPSRDGNERADRVGFVVPIKSIRGAVRRNRVRRLMKEAVRQWWPYIPQGHDILLIAGGEPERDHAWYVEAIFLRMLLQMQLLTSDGIVKAEEKLASLPDEFSGGPKRGEGA